MRFLLSTWRSEYPFIDRFASIDGRKYHYIDEGEGEQPIVCVHGNPTWSFYYRRLVAGLRSEARVLAVDHIGCGLSEKPRDYPYNLAQHTANLVEWLDKLDIQNGLLVVHDWGGAIGLGAAVARPDRIAKLLILNTAAFPPPYVPLRIAALRFPWMGSFAIRYLNGFAWPATFMTMHRHRLSENAKSGLLAPYLSAETRWAIDGFVKDIPLSRSHPTYQVLQTLESRLATLADKPTRIVWGMKDWCFRPQCKDRLLEHLPNASQRLLQDVGHYVMEDAPDEVLEETRLLLHQRSGK